MAKRDYRYEFIRVVSMVLVVGVHGLATVPAESALETFGANVLNTVFFFCNGLFFMLSGKFALAARCETPAQYASYYLKRFCSIGVPALVFMLMRTMHNAGWWPAYLVSPELWTDYVSNVLGGFRSCEYWFLYPLAGLLTAAPFLGKALQRAGRGELCLFVAIGLGYNALQTYVPDFQWNYPLGNWMVLFVLGYALERIAVTPRQETAVILVGAGCFCLTVLCKQMGNAPGANDMAPAYAGMVCGVFLLLKRLYRPGKRQDALVELLGKQSLAVYMLHMLFLPGILAALPVESFWLRLPFLVLLTVAVSLAAAWIVNHVLIFPLQWCFGRMMGLLLSPASLKR